MSLLRVQIELGSVPDASLSGALYYRRSVLWKESTFAPVFDGNYCKRWMLEDPWQQVPALMAGLQPLI